MRETFICPYHFSSLTPPFPDTVATNVDEFIFLVNTPVRYQTSLPREFLSAVVDNLKIYDLFSVILSDLYYNTLALFGTLH